MSLSGFTAPLLGVATLWTLAVVTPGPNFLMMTRLALGESRRAGLWAVPGIGLGTLIWTLSGYLGIHTLFEAAPWAYLGLKLAGGAYLIVLGVRLLRAAPQAAGGIVSVPPRSAVSSFRIGLITNLTNPKSALLVTSVFAATLPPGTDLTLGAASIVLMVTISMLWYALLVRIVSTVRVRALFGRWQCWIDRTAGAIFVLFGARLIAFR